MDIHPRTPTLTQLLTLVCLIAVVVVAAAAPQSATPGRQRSERAANRLAELEKTTLVPVPPKDGDQKNSRTVTVEDKGPPRSVLQLNVIDQDGSMTEVVYPGKMVALQLHAAHHGTLGAAVVRECSMTNPLLQTTRGGRPTPFSQTILSQGCGLGEVLPTDSGFFRRMEGGHTTTTTTPFFPLPHSWALQTSLLFACDVTICADVTHCRQSCPPPHSSDVGPNVTGSGRHDVTVLMESQMVTSCPEAGKTNHTSWHDAADDEVNRGMMFLPDCFPDGSPAEYSTVLRSDDGENSPAGASGNDVTEGSRPLWQTGQMLSILIPSVLCSMVLLFTIATLCKLLTLQRRLESCNKGIEQMEKQDTLLKDLKHQETQTPMCASPNSLNEMPVRCSYCGESLADKELASVVSGEQSSEVCPLTAKSVVFEMEDDSSEFSAPSLANAGRVFPPTRTPV